MKEKFSFMGVEESLKHEVIIVVIHMHKKKVTVNLGVKGNTKGF